MSILKSHPNGWIISHSLFSKLELGLGDGTKGDKTVQLQLHPDLFKLTTPFRKEKKIKKRDGNQPEVKEEENEKSTEPSHDVKILAEEILREGKKCDIFKTIGKTDKDNEKCGNIVNDNNNNFQARQFAKDFYETVKEFPTFPKFMKENDSDFLATTIILFDNAGNFHNFILPPKSVVHCDSVDNLKKRLIGNKYSLVVLDPPWRNKFVRRRKRKQQEAGYYMMECEDIQRLPIKDLTNDDALVVVWCTNKKAHQQQILNEFFPSWGLDYFATWYWVKVTADCNPICPFNSENMKQPYETIILGRRRTNLRNQSSSKGAFSSSSELNQDKVIVSVPSSIHSHKPPLIDILRDYVDDSELNVSNCLELFARYAVSNCTSYGNEVLKLSHQSLYMQNPPPKKLCDI